MFVVSDIYMADTPFADWFTFSDAKASISQEYFYFWLVWCFWAVPVKMA